MITRWIFAGGALLLLGYWVNAQPKNAASRSPESLQGEVGRSILAGEDSTLWRRTPKLALKDAVDVAQRYVATHQLDLARNFLTSVEWEEKAPAPYDPDIEPAISGPCWKVTYGNRQKIAAGGEVYLWIGDDQQVVKRLGL